MAKENKEINPSDPFDIRMDFSLFASIKYNKAMRRCFNEYDKKEFDNFKTLFKRFLHKVKENDPTASSDLSSIMSMWGYHRKYCGMCGRPVIGKLYRIQGRKIVCHTCNESYKITDKLSEKDVSEDLPVENIETEKIIESENETTK